MNADDLIFVKTSIKTAIKLFDVYRLDDSLEDYSAPILSVAHAAESMIAVILTEKGFQIKNGMCTNCQESTNHKSTPFTAFLANAQQLGVPSEICGFVDVMRRSRNASAHLLFTSYDEFLLFLEAFAIFTAWFIEESGIVNLQDTEQATELLNYMHKIRTSYVEWTIIDMRTKRPILSKADVDQALPKNFICARYDNFSSEMIGVILGLAQEIKDGVARMEKKLDTMAEQLSLIYDKMTNYQELLERQISLAVSDDEVDRIIKAYSDEVSSQIVHKVVRSIRDAEFDVEEKRLQDSLGQPVWNRLDLSSREFLVTAKVTYSSYNKIGKAVDYSGVCLLVTKAIEVEMSNRFCRDYLRYLQSKYPGKTNHCKYPQVMLNKYGKPIKPKDFTLGSVAYVLGVQKDSSLGDAELQRINDEIFDFCRCKIMIGKDDEYIANTLEQIAEGIEQIRKDYRNPSAHTNQLQKINAKECFDLVLDVEKLLKTMIESLDY